MTDQDDFGLTFSDEDFERRYSPEDRTETAARSGAAPAPAKEAATPLVRSRTDHRRHAHTAAAAPRRIRPHLRAAFLG